MSHRPQLRGCIPILATPFDESGAIDFRSLDSEIEWLLAEGASGVAALAIASEGYKLTESERDAVARATVARVRGKVPVVLSADGAGTDVAVARAQTLAGIGADALMVLPPSFVKPGQDAVYDYYRRIGESVDIPIIIQDAPQLTGVAMGPALWSRLAADVATIRYVKAEGSPQGSTLSESIRRSEGRLAVFCGWGGLGLLDALERGAVGSMPAPNFTRLFARVQQAWESGNREAAANEFHVELPFILWTMQSVDYSILAAKEEMRQRGVITSGSVRQPSVELDVVSRRQLGAWIEKRLAGHLGMESESSPPE